MIAGMIAKQHQIIAMRILRSSGKTEECYMEKRIQEELFDVEVQYCDPDDCRYDCKNASDYRNSYMISLW